MKELPEHRGKAWLSEAGIRTPEGTVVSALSQLPEWERPTVVKAQIPVSGRGKKGAIKFASDPEEMRNTAKELLASHVDGHRVDTLLIEEQLELEQEIYLGIAADGHEELPVFMLSLNGGQDIESVPDSEVAEIKINPLVGFQSYHFRMATAELEAHGATLSSLPVSELEDIAKSAWELFCSSDLRLLEINPIGITEGTAVAVDAKLVLDEAASFRRADVETSSTLSKLEQRADEDGIELRVDSGSVGIISNGAGMGLATLDLVADRSDEGLAGFIDTHGAQFDWEEIHDFLSYLRDADASVVLVNIIGPFLDCSKIAQELASAVEQGYDVPIVARFKGLGHEEGIAICNEAGIETDTSVVAAVDKATAAVDRGDH